MNQPRLHPLEEILLAIDGAAPQPWYYREECKRFGYDPEGVERILELLHLEGLITRGTERSSGEGPGVVLTPKAEQLLRDPEALERLRKNEPIDTRDPGAIVRHTLRHAVNPIITKLIVGANLAMFVWCLYLASKVGVLNSYMQWGGGSLKILKDVLHPAGSVSAVDIVRGEWWRLLTTCFLHGNALHIFMNMYTLYFSGKFVEQTWGRWRYAIIYLISGWAGSCLAMALSPSYIELGKDVLFIPLVGASGAICGILATEGVWVFLNGKYLPRQMAQRGRSQILTTIVMMVFISLLPNVSGYAHFGGAAAGAVAATALNVLRFSTSPLRFAAIAVLALLPVASYFHLDQARRTSRAWQEAEAKVFNDDWVSSMGKTHRQAVEIYNTQIRPLRDFHPERRDAEKVQEAITALDSQIAALDELVEHLGRSGPFYDAEVSAARQNAIDYTRQRADAYRDARRCLEVGEAWTAKDEKAFDEKLTRLRELRAEWQKRLE